MPLTAPPIAIPSEVKVTCLFEQAKVLVVVIVPVPALMVKVALALAAPVKVMSEFVAVNVPAKAIVPPDGDLIVKGSLKVIVLTVAPPVLSDRPIVIELKPLVKEATSAVLNAKSVAAPSAPITIGLEIVEGCNIRVPVPVMVLAVVFKTTESAVMLILPEPEAMVLPAPAVNVKVPLSPVPAINVMAPLAVAVVNAPVTVIAPATPGDWIVIGSVKVTALTATAPVPSDLPIVIELKPLVKEAISAVLKAKSVAAPSAPITIGRDVVEGCNVRVPVPVMVSAVVFKTAESAVILILPEPEAMVLPAPAVSVKVPELPVPAINVTAELLAAVVNAPVMVMAPATPGDWIVIGSEKVTALTATAPVPSVLPMVIPLNPFCK